MEKRENSLEREVDLICEKFMEKSENKEIFIISHFDTDGISSAAIMIQTLKNLDKKFSVKIVKSLEKEFIDSLPKEKIILFFGFRLRCSRLFRKYEHERYFYNRPSRNNPKHSKRSLHSKFGVM